MSPRNPKASTWSKKATAVFLDVLGSTGNVSAASRAAGVRRMAAYRRRSKDAAFAANWADAIEHSLDELEYALRRRAVDGTDKPVYYGGEKVGDVKSFNDNLGMFLLRARRRDVFAEGLKGDDGMAQFLVDADEVRSRLLAKLEAISPGVGE